MTDTVIVPENLSQDSTTSVPIVIMSEKNVNDDISGPRKTEWSNSPMNSGMISNRDDQAGTALETVSVRFDASAIDGPTTETTKENTQDTNTIVDSMLPRANVSSSTITGFAESQSTFLLGPSTAEDSIRTTSGNTIPSKKSFTWPSSSKDCLPHLADGTIQKIIHESSFPINEECTALTIPPSGRHIVAGFTDGTVRLFDTTGRLWSGGRKIDDEDEEDENDSDSSRRKRKNRKNGEENIFDCDSSSDSKMETQPLKKFKHNQMVLSKSHQTFGAVACQIYARGVITSLLMDVATSEDGLYAFAGVLRGSTELVAVDLSGIELFHDEFEAKKKTLESNRVYDLLDLVQVYTYSDAKLKGFGACTRLKNGRRKLEYRLFTGKGIKNMHIWAFIPPQEDVKEPIWQCLYDTATNGNSINYLHFRYDANGILQGLTKSDDQRLRVWDLSYEQHKGKRKDKFRSSVIKQLAMQSIESSTERPKRPPCVDVACTENALGVFGGYVFSGGSAMYNQISVTSLDVEDVTCQFNHSEFALPFVDVSEAMDDDGGKRAYRSGRQQRGDLKSVATIAGLEMDGRHVVLEMSDGYLMHYLQDDNQESSVQILPVFSKNDSNNSLGILDESPSVTGKAFCVSRIGSEGAAILASAQFDPIQGRGSIRLRELTNWLRNKVKSGKVDSVEFWGFHGVTLMMLPIQYTLVPIETPIHGGKSATKRSKKVLLQSEASQLFVTPEPKATVSKAKRQKTKMVKESIVDAQSPILSPPVPMTKTEEQPFDKDLVLPIVESVKSRASKPVNIISDSPEKQLNEFDDKGQKQSDQMGISAFFQRTKVTRKGEKKERSHVKTSNKAQLDNNISTTSEGQTFKDKLPLSLEPKSLARTSEAIVSYEFSAQYSNMIQNKQPPPMLESAADIFYSVYRNKRYRVHIDEISSSLSDGSNIDLIPLWKTHESARKKLSDQHSAAHLRFFQSFMSCSQQVVATGLNRNEARGWFDEFIQERKDVLKEMLERQEMEAETLASLQTCENGGIAVERVAVSFPFPDIFDK